MADSEKRLVGKFVLWAADLKDGRSAIIGPEHVEAIKAAAERIARQARANSRNGRRGAPKPVKDDKRSIQLREAQARRRARLKGAAK